jgi:hypothetical protein
MFYKVDITKYIADRSAANKLYSCQKEIFKDENLLEVSGVQNSDLVKRLFDMIEAFANRMALLENKI